MRTDDRGRASPTVTAVTVICAASMHGLGIWAYAARDVPSLGLLTLLAVLAIAVRLNRRPTRVPK
jgi:hypothetical protein